MTDQTKKDERDGQQETRVEAELEANVADDEEINDDSSDDEESVAVGAPATGARREKGPSKLTISREDRRRRSQARKARRKLFYGVGGGLIAVALITGLVLPSVGHLGVGPSNDGSGSSTAQGSSPSVGTQLPIQFAGIVEVGAAHEAYETSPPTSGPRYAEAVEWGAYETQQPDEAVVRNLELGGIVVNHNLSDKAQIDNLETFIEAQPGYPGCFVVQPYESLASGSVTITSWGWLDSYTAVDRAAMQGFIADHRNAGPLFVGSTCGSDAELATGASVDNTAGP